MTPTEVLEDVKSRFVVLYHKDDTVLWKLLRRALLKYQDKAGALTELWTEDAEIAVPSNFKAPASCCDAKRRYIPYRWDVSGKKITLNPGDRHEKPYCLTYFLNLRDWADNQDLPHDVSSMVCDYLEALIAVPNTMRQKETYLLTDMSSAAQELPSLSELKSNIDLLEQAMEEHKAIVPPLSGF